MRPFISFIIPVFNCADGLRICVDSILQMKEACIEIILVDDCSTDNTPAVCDELSHQYSVIRVIHMPENGGVGAAREAGMSAARGVYFFFADSDDRIDSAAFKSLLEKRELWQGTDLLCFNYVIDCGNCSRKMSLHSQEGLLTADLFLERLPQFRPCTVWPWIFKKEFVLYNNIHFPPLVSGEDHVFVCQAVLWAERIYVYPESLYYYTSVPRSTALSQNIDFIRVMQSVEAIWKMIIPLEKNGGHTSQKQRMLRQYVSGIMTELSSYPTEMFHETVGNGSPERGTEKDVPRRDILAAVERHWSTVWNCIEEKTERFTRPAFICPSGRCAFRLAEKLFASGGKVEGFLDNYRTGHCSLAVHGQRSDTRIHSFRELNTLESKPYLIVFSVSDIAESIRRQLEDMGYSEDVDFICL